MRILLKKSYLIKLALLAAILSAPLYTFRLKIFGIPTNISELATLFSIILWLMWAEKKYFSKKITANVWVLGGAMGLLIGTIISLWGANYSLAGMGILKSWFVIPIVFSLALLDEINYQSDFEIVAASVFVSTLLVSLSALIYKLGGIVTFDGRLSAFYGSPNYLAMYISPGILCGLYCSNMLKNSSRIRVTAILFAVFLEIVVLFFTQSYASWTGLILALFFVFFYWSPSERRSLVIICSIAICGFLFASQIGSPKLSSLLTNNPRSSLASRVMIWKASWMMLEKNPFLGIGAGNFQKEYLLLQPYFPPYLEWAVPEPHNIFLGFWLQTGLLGLISFTFILFFSTYSLLKKVAYDKKNAPSIMLVAAFFIYIFGTGLFDTPYWKNDLSLVFWIFVALAMSLATKYLPGQITDDHSDII
jgi:O-antigen ligase